MSQIIDIQEALTDLLNTASLSQEFTAARVYIPNYSISDSPGLLVFVLGLNSVVDMDAGMRDGTNVETHTITVAVYNQIPRINGQPKSSNVDAMMVLVQELTDFIKTTPQILEDGTTLVGIRTSPVYDPALLDSQNTFCSVLQLDYRLLR